MADKDSVDDILNEADQLESDESEEEQPSKKRKRSHESKDKNKKKKKSKKYSSSSSEDEELSPEKKAKLEEDSIQRKELRRIMIRHPGLNIEKVLAVCAEVQKMDPADVSAHLEASKISLGATKPMAEAESWVGLMAFGAQHWLGQPSRLYSAFMQDSQLVAAVDEYAPKLGEKLNGPASIAVRVLGHMNDAKYNLTNFSNVHVEQPQ